MSKVNQIEMRIESSASIQFNYMTFLKYFIFFSLVISGCKQAPRNEEQSKIVTEQHRPQIHFSPQANWMNDPNGMVFFNNRYHLFYQYYPDSTVWGPMHWGHASTTDLVNWEHHPVALYPDSLGYIFSGSAVAAYNNTSGFGKDGVTPLVAIFTHHDPKAEKAGSNRFENQSIAYSLDEGMTWTKYEGNPVLKNPGIKDFRDPKVSWYEPGEKWIMTLAVRDRISFYSSTDLKNWVKESEFGDGIGAHDGVWECPDLFSMDHNGRTIWVLLVSVGSGGPNGGSATQYFTGEFDGREFKANDSTIKWVDYGPDNYAGVTWSNTADRRIFIGWMSNWQYANTVPTQKWRSAMTIPRELSLVNVGDQYHLVSNPVPELEALSQDAVNLENINVRDDYPLSGKIRNKQVVSRLELQVEEIDDFSILMTNRQHDSLVLGYDKMSNQYFIDRQGSGDVGFHPEFARHHTAPRINKGKNAELVLITDNASVELFADNGLTVMTAVFFPKEPLTDYTIRSAKGIIIKQLTYTGLKEAKIK